jgi:NAD(P)H-hydrate epimerase
MDPLSPLTLPALPVRAPDSHKGDHGTVLVVAGSRRFPGAAILTALGAGRAGAGLVRCALPAGCLPCVVPAVPFATVLPSPEGEGGGLAEAAAEIIVAASFAADVLVLGPGLGDDDGTGRLVRQLLERVALPVVLDADGLNHVARLGLDVLRERHEPTVLLPHPGEFARLGGGTVPAADERVDRAAALARDTGCVVVLKGRHTVVTDGARVYVESAGNPGMAVGGMGDVLAGVTGALLARIPAPAEAAALAVHLHALAGDLGTAELGEESLLPEDLALRLGRVMRPLKQRPIRS